MEMGSGVGEVARTVCRARAWLRAACLASGRYAAAFDARGALACAPARFLELEAEVFLAACPPTFK